MILFEEKIMAIWVKIRKYSEKNNVGYYAVFKQDYETIEFYLGIDRQLQLLFFYLTKDFSKPEKIIDLNKKNQILETLPGTSRLSLMKALSRGAKALHMETLPEILDYIA